MPTKTCKTCIYWDERNMLCVEDPGAGACPPDNPVCEGYASNACFGDKNCMHAVGDSCTTDEPCQFKQPNAHALAEERSDDSQQRVVGLSESTKGD